MKVKTFAGWLKRKYEIVSFIDSTVWGYANDLLMEMDDKYCKDDAGHLLYKLTTQSSAHIHMLLQCALAKMINKCECDVWHSYDIDYSIIIIKPSVADKWILLENKYPGYVETFLSANNYLGNVGSPLNVAHDIGLGQVNTDKSNDYGGEKGYEGIANRPVRQFFVNRST